MAVVAVACGVMVIACRVFVPRATGVRLRRFAIAHILALSLLTLVMVNWRLYGWLAATGNLTVAEARERIPLWTMNLFTVVLCALMAGMVFVTFRPGRVEAQAR
jgi:hypothetical protein